MRKDKYEINAVACIVLTRKYRPNYYRDPKLDVNSGLPPGRTYSLKEYRAFKEKQINEVNRNV